MWEPRCDVLPDASGICPEGHLTWVEAVSATATTNEVTTAIFHAFFDAPSPALASGVGGVALTICLAFASPVLLRRVMDSFTKAIGI